MHSPRIFLGSTRLRSLWPWLLIPLVSFAWFWLWRSGMWVGGDSEHWEREINSGIWLRRRQLLSFATMQFAFTVGRLLAGWSARCAINFVSCAAGALAMLALWRLLAGQRRPLLAFALVATAGFTTIFYGHIETYAQPVAALLLHLLAIRRTAQRRWQPWTIAATFCLVLAFHLVILFALPATLWVLARELQRRHWRRHDVAAAALAALPGVLLWAFIWLGRLGQGELVGPHFMAPPAVMLRQPWVLLTDPCNYWKIRFVFWNAGAASLVALGVFAQALRRPRRDPFVLYLACYFAWFMVFFIIWHPDANDRDFDLFCFPWVIACVAVARTVHALPWRPVLLGLIFGVNLYLGLTRTLVFADLPGRGSGTILYENTLGPDEPTLLRLDDAFLLFPVNRCVPAGGHQVFARIEGRMIRRAINLRPGETCRVRVGPAGLSVEGTSPAPDSP